MRDLTSNVPFAPNNLVNSRVLINTSGSGKTRLLLEGLCREWGFYFVAKQDTTRIGSNDLWSVMDELDDSHDYQEAKERLEGADPASEVAQAAFKHIHEVVERRLAQLLLARFLLLDLLVQEAQKLQHGLQPQELRRLWVLLQVQPSILFPKQDAFQDFTKTLNGASTTDLKARIHEKYHTLSGLLQEAHNLTNNPTFFCVLDEVQITVSQKFGRLGEFLSQDKTTKRPILRTIWFSWSEVFKSGQMSLVLSGTGIELQALNDALSSAFHCARHWCLRGQKHSSPIYTTVPARASRQEALGGVSHPCLGLVSWKVTIVNFSSSPKAKPTSIRQVS